MQGIYAALTSILAKLLRCQALICWGEGDGTGAQPAGTGAG